MDTTTMSAVAINSVTEILIRMFGSVNYTLSDSVAAGIVVGGCTLVGGFLGGRFGLLVGGGIGSTISTYLGQTIRSLRDLIQELNTTQLQLLYVLLFEEIQSTIRRTIDQTINFTSLSLENIIQRYGNNALIQSNIIQTITNFFSGVYGNGLRRIEA